VAPLAGTALCQVHHQGFVQPGSMRVRVEDGTERDLVAGDLFDLPPGHDAWDFEGTRGLWPTTWPSTGPQRSPPGTSKGVDAALDYYGRLARLTDGTTARTWSTCTATGMDTSSRSTSQPSATASRTSPAARCC
jgi:hypothetical protein